MAGHVFTRDRVLELSVMPQQLPLQRLREFGERLANAGVRFRQVRHRAICLHLEHPRPYVNAQSWARNRAFREHTRRERLAWTPCGIVQGDALPAPRSRAAA